MKFSDTYRKSGQEDRLIPFGMSGLKLPLFSGYSYNELSHPVWDEWIEIDARISSVFPSARLIPFGMSGLKYCFGVPVDSDRRSHPVWDEWIEISGRY